MNCKSLSWHSLPRAPASSSSSIPPSAAARQPGASPRRTSPKIWASASPSLRYSAQPAATSRPGGSTPSSAAYSYISRASSFLPVPGCPASSTGRPWGGYFTAALSCSMQSLMLRVLPIAF